MTNETKRSTDTLTRVVLAMLKEARDMDTDERNKRDAGKTVGEWARGYRGGYVQAVRDLCARADREGA